MTPVAEKTTFALDLSKGMDERTRPELMTGPPGVTSIINMVQDQTGAWTKRPGTTQTTVSDASGTGTNPTSTRAILKLANGWGIIADGGRLLHKQSGTSKLRSRPGPMALTPTSAHLIGSSVNRAPSGGGGLLDIVSSASCSTHDAVVLRTAAGTLRLNLYEVATGNLTEYNLISAPTAGYYIVSSSTAFLAFVGNRYLHVYFTAYDNVNTWAIELFCIDVTADLPVNAAAMTVYGGAALSPGAGVPTKMAVVGGATRSFFLCTDSSGVTKTLSMLGSNPSVSPQSFTMAHAYTDVDLDEPRSRLWFMVAGATTRFIALDSTNLSGAEKVATFTSTKPGTYISCNTTDGTLRVVYQTVTSSSYVEVLSLSGTTVTVVGAVWGYLLNGKPFYLSSTNKHYCVLGKYRFSATLGPDPLVLADLSTFRELETNSSGLALPYGVLGNACNVEPYVGILEYLTPSRPSVLDSGSTAAVQLKLRTTARGISVGAVRLTANSPLGYGSACLGGDTYIASGGLNVYDGESVSDVGFPCSPDVSAAVVAAAGNLSDGAYSYVAVKVFVDANGNRTYSQTSSPVTVTTSAGHEQVTLTLFPEGVTNHIQGNYNAPFLEVYRTAVGGTQYYLCASSQTNLSTSDTPNVQQIVISATTGLLTVTDNLSDATLLAQGVMHRQPGNTNTPADRYPAPACNFVITHKDRLFCTDPYGQRVYYSSFFVDGEAAWFNPTFSFYVHGGSGPITGLASMDGRLFIFKRDGIWVVDGDGPTEAGPDGTEFSPPQKLAGNLGCVDRRSIGVTPDGIVFRSTRGFELLGRGLQLRWIGDRVLLTAGAHPVTTSCCVDHGKRVRWTVSESETYAGVVGADGVELVWDFTNDTWAVGKYTSIMNGAVYGRALQCVEEVLDGGSPILAFGGNGGEFLVEYVYHADQSSVGVTYEIPCTIETGWKNLGTQQRQRVTTVLALLKSHSPHATRISLAFDYVDNYTHVTTWQPSVLSTLGIEELAVKPVQPQTLAIRVKLELVKDSENASAGNYGFADVLSISAEMVPLPGAPFANRGVVGVLSVPPEVSAALPVVPVMIGGKPGWGIMASGSVGGGDTVFVYGDSFDANTTFTFGGAAATGVAIVSAHKATMTSPAHSAGTVDVVASNGGGSGTLVGGFTFA